MKNLIIFLTLFLFSCISKPSKNPIFETLNDKAAFFEDRYQKSDTLKIIYYSGSDLPGQLVYFGNHDYVALTVGDRFQAKNREEAEKFIVEVNKKYKASIAMLVDETAMAVKFEDQVLGQKKYSVGFFAKRK